MKGIPVEIDVTVEDVLLVSDLLDGNGTEEIRRFATKFLMCVKDTSERLRESIKAVEGANPCSMEKIEI